jgi:hypothetical protein
MSAAIDRKLEPLGRREGRHLLDDQLVLEIGRHDALTVTTDDHGNTGIGGALTDTDTVAINLLTHLFGTPNNDAFDALPGNERVDALGGFGDTVTPFAPSELIAANGFDFVWYLQHNPDVAAANVDPFQHFMTAGWTEGRNPNALFDTSGYLATYADVAAAHVNPLTHYDEFGRHEGRDPSVGFDTTSYLAAYPDVAASHVNPLTHFLQFGTHEGRSPFADGIWG